MKIVCIMMQATDIGVRCEFSLAMTAAHPAGLFTDAADGEAALNDRYGRVVAAEVAGRLI